MYKLTHNGTLIEEKQKVRREMPWINEGGKERKTANLKKARTTNCRKLKKKSSKKVEDECTGFFHAVIIGSSQNNRLTVREVWFR